MFWISGSRNSGRFLLNFLRLDSVLFPAVLLLINEQKTFEIKRLRVGSAESISEQVVKIKN